MTFAPYSPVFSTWALSSVMLLAALFLMPVPEAAAGHRDGHGSIRHSERYLEKRIELDIEYRDRDALRLQREAIAAEEEARREERRHERREELEKQREEAEKEYLDFKKDLRSVSSAARSAPRNHFYRRPGHLVSSLPPGRETITEGGERYHYYSGIFFTKTPTGYVAITAPPGAVVSDLPPGLALLPITGRTLYYYFGSFFEETPGGYIVTVPPPGITVHYLPEGYRKEGLDGSLRYLFGGIGYQPFYRNGILVYMVVADTPP